jgi:hypothetical protein
MSQSLADTLHDMINLLHWREESRVIAAHQSVDEHFSVLVPAHTDEADALLAVVKDLGVKDGSDA